MISPLWRVAAATRRAGARLFEFLRAFSKTAQSWRPSWFAWRIGQADSPPIASPSHVLGTTAVTSYHEWLAAPLARVRVPVPRLADDAIAVVVKVIVQPATGRHLAYCLAAEASQGQEEFPPARHRVLFGDLRGSSFSRYRNGRFKRLPRGPNAWLRHLFQLVGMAQPGYPPRQFPSRPLW